MKNHDAFTRSSLGRSKPKKRFFSVIHDALKRKKIRSNIGLVEDGTSSTTVVRVILGLLMVHLVVIGGVLLKGHFDKLAGGVAVPRTVTPPPVAEASVPQEEAVLPPATAPLTVEAAAPGNHITQAASSEPAEIFPEEAVEVVAAPTPAPAQTAAAAPAPAPAEVVAVEPAPAAPAVAEEPAAPEQAQPASVTERYLVSSGDTWYGIAKANNISVKELKAANPAAASKKHLQQGVYLNVPLKADSEAAKAAVAKAAAAEAASTYTVKRGDTLGKIAKKHKMSLPALKKLNNLTNDRIKPGQKLKISK